MNKITVPCVPFYFVRHGQTDWNKTNQELCDQDNISLNETGLLQAEHAANKVISLNIEKIYSSPLKRAAQTAEIINKNLNLTLTFHDGLGKISEERIINTFFEILVTSQTSLIVSHGEVYRVLLRILSAQAIDINAKNGGIYYFNPPTSNSNTWIAHPLN